MTNRGKIVIGYFLSENTGLVHLPKVSSAFKMMVIMASGIENVICFTLTQMKALFTQYFPKFCEEKSTGKTLG